MSAFKWGSIPSTVPCLLHFLGSHADLFFVRCTYYKYSNIAGIHDHNARLHTDGIYSKTSTVLCSTFPKPTQLLIYLITRSTTPKAGAYKLFQSDTAFLQNSGNRVQIFPPHDLSPFHQREVGEILIPTCSLCASKLEPKLPNTTVNFSTRGLFAFFRRSFEIMRSISLYIITNLNSLGQAWHLRVWTRPGAIFYQIVAR